MNPVAERAPAAQPGANGFHEGSGWGGAGKKGGGGDGAIAIRTDGAAPAPPPRGGPAAAAAAAAAADWDAVNSRDQLLSQGGVTSSALLASRSPPRGGAGAGGAPGAPPGGAPQPTVGGLFQPRTPGATSLMRFDSAAETGGGGAGGAAGAGAAGGSGAGLGSAPGGSGSDSGLARGASNAPSELGRGGPSGDLSQQSEAGDTPHSLMATATSQGSLSRIDAMRFWMVRCRDAPPRGSLCCVCRPSRRRSCLWVGGGRVSWRAA